MTKSLVSVVIPTYNRPALIGKAIKSVLNQTYQDFEVIVVDDGMEKGAEKIVNSFNDSRISYIKHKYSKGGGAARNTGIKSTKGKFIAFLDDDDEWVSEKLEVQMGEFEKTSQDVGFSFTAVTDVYEDREESGDIPSGVADYHERALSVFAGFLTVTLIIKKYVFEDIGYFDENFPSHQEPDLMIRVTKKYKGLGIDKSLTRVNMKERVHINSSFVNRINGRKMILEKYAKDFEQRPALLAKHYFDLAIFCRDDNRLLVATRYFIESIKRDFRVLYIAHLLNVYYLLVKRKING